MINVKENFVEFYSEYENLSQTEIQAKYFESEFRVFVLEYDIYLTEFINTLGKTNKPTIELEMDFICGIVKYLIEKNNLEVELHQLLQHLDLEDYQEQYLISYKDYEELWEKKNLSLPEKEMLLNYHIFLILEESRDRLINLSKTRKLFEAKCKFLDIQLERLGFEVYYHGGIKFRKVEKESPEQFMVSSDKVMNTARSKFIMMNEIGVIKFLQNKYKDCPTSTIGKILEDITGSHQQQVYNAFETNNLNHNHPYREPKEGMSNPVENVKNRLRGYGIKIDN